MRFSIIVPVYNIEDWLEACVNSILQQSFEDCEVLLVDDGSVDDSGMLCDEYAKRSNRVRCFHKQNGGLSDARNYGIERAKGEYLLFVDGDDYLGENALLELNKEIERGHADVILSEGKYIVTDNKIKSDIRFHKEEFDGISGRDALLITTKIMPNWSAWGKCFRTEFWKKCGFEFAKGRISEDFQLIDRVILEADTVGMVPAYYYYQYRANSIVHTVNAKSLADILLSMKEWKDYFNLTRIDEKVRKQMLSLQAELFCHSVLGYIDLIESKERNDILTEANKFVDYLKYNSSLECKLIYCSCKCIGLRQTCRMLGVVKRKRLKRG